MCATGAAIPLRCAAIRVQMSWLLLSYISSGYYSVTVYWYDMCVYCMYKVVRIYTLIDCSVCIAFNSVLYS